MSEADDERATIPELDEGDATEANAATNTNRVHITRRDTMAFAAETPAGHRVLIDGPPSLGGPVGSDGQGEAMRPMELFLASLASCMSVDVVMILQKQKQTITGYDVHVEGRRADAVPAVYESIHLRFELAGEIAENKLQRACKLSVEKYCSVASMLLPSVKVTWEASLLG
ncbi:MAG: OsmC family protein [Myxococcota bacterium]